MLVVPARANPVTSKNFRLGIPPRAFHARISRRINAAWTWGWSRTILCSNWDSAEWSDFADFDRAWRGSSLGTRKASVPPTDTAAMPCQVARRPMPRPSTNMHGVAMHVPPVTTNPKNVRSVLTSEEVAFSKAASLSSSGTSDSMPSSTAMLERASL